MEHTKLSQKVGSAIGAHVVMWSSHRPVQDLRAFLVGKTYAAANRGTTAAATTEAIRPIAADHRPCLRGPLPPPPVPPYAAPPDG